MPRESGFVSLLSRHTLKQLKFVLPGGAITYWLDTHNRFWSIASSASQGWARTAAVASLASGMLTVSLFLYILMMPLIKGVQPNYRQWRETGELSSVIPLLTASMVTGWSLLAFTLSQYSELGFLEGIIGSVGAYMLIFGLMGLIPAPKVHRQ